MTLRSARQDEVKRAARAAKGPSVIVTSAARVLGGGGACPS